MEDFGERRGGFGGGRRFGGGFGGRGRGPRRGGGGDFGEKPVKVGEEYDVEIESVAEKGDGVAKIKGLVVFVPGAQKGEKIRIRIKDIKRKCAIAERAGEASAAPVETSEESSEAPAEESTETAEEESAEAEEADEEEY